jgi:hypothetical protein
MTMEKILETEEVIDLGAASAETMGGQYDFAQDNLVITRKLTPGMAAD